MCTLNILEGIIYSLETHQYSYGEPKQILEKKVFVVNFFDNSQYEIVSM